MRAQVSGSRSAAAAAQHLGTLRRVAAIGAGLVVLAGCGAGGEASSSPPPAEAGHAVVLVSGAGVASPFTTPTAACAVGLAAGSTDTALRAGLLKSGFAVYTAPAQVGLGQVTSAIGLGGFSDCPKPLTSAMTINSAGGAAGAAASLTAFLNYLREKEGINSVDLVSHGEGGLYSAVAMTRLQVDSSTLKVRSLTTLGAPWQGSLASTPPVGVPALGPVPVTLIAGEKNTKPGGPPTRWPNDGVVARVSALATGVSEKVMPQRSCVSRPDVHGIAQADAARLPWERALTWDPTVLAAVTDALNAAKSGTPAPNRKDCP